MRKKDEQIPCDFSVSLGLTPTMLDELKLQDGALGVLGKVASFEEMRRENGLLGGVGEVASWFVSEKRSSTYKLVAVVKVVAWDHAAFRWQSFPRIIRPVSLAMGSWCMFNIGTGRSCG